MRDFKDVVGGRHGFIVMAGRVPAIFAPADEARMAGTRPAMTMETGLVRSNNSSLGHDVEAMGWSGRDVQGGRL